MVQRAYDFVRDDARNISPRAVPSSPTGSSSKGTFRFTNDPTHGATTVRSEFFWKRLKHNPLTLLYQNDILALLFSQLFLRYASALPGDSPVTVRQLEIPFFSEYERNGFVYRAHPLYRGESAYYDWAFVQWVVGQNPVSNAVIHKPYVARILGFVKHPCGDMQAIVHSVKEPPPGKDISHGVFGEFWELEYQGPASAKRPLLHLISVDSVLEHACMIPYSADHPYTWFHIWDSGTWADCFQTILAPGLEPNTGGI